LIDHLFDPPVSGWVRQMNPIGPAVEELTFNIQQIVKGEKEKG